MKLRTLMVIVLSIACVGAFASSASALQMYTPDYNDDEIAGTDFQGVAPAASIPGSTWDFGGAGGGLWAVGINRDGVRGVAAYGFSPAIEPFSIAADGSLASPQPTLAGTGGYSLAMSPNSDFVYFAANVTPFGITAARQAADGSLTYLPGSPFASGGGFGDLAITPNGRYLFASGNPAGSIRRFSIEADGSLGPIGTALIDGADLMQVSPDGRFLYVMASTDTDRIHSLAIGSDGSLTEVPPAYVIGDFSTGKFSVSPDGSRLYVPNANLDQIITLASSATGVLSLIGSLPVPDDFKSVSVSATGELFMVRTNAGGGLYYSKPDPITTLPSAPVLLTSENFNYGLRTAFRPGFGGTAGPLKVTPNAKPLSFTLDATGSTGFSRLEWSTGGIAPVTATTATKAKFDAPSAGTIPISVRAFDASGCASELHYTGQLIVCSGNPNAIKTVNYDTPPWVTSLKVSPSRVTSKTKIKLKLTEKASVSFYVQKPVKGRTVGTSCKKRTKKNKSAKKCTLWVRASTTLRKSGKAGRTNSVKFTGKVGKKQLAKGSYRLFAVATDSAKGKGPSKTASFKIK